MRAHLVKKKKWYRITSDYWENKRIVEVDGKFCVQPTLCYVIINY